MKKTIGIIIALLALCLMLTLPTFAEESTDIKPPGIAAADLSFEGEVHIYFDLYVGETISDDLEYGMIFWTEEQAEGDYTYDKAIVEGAPAIIRGKKTATDDTYKEHPVKVFKYSVASKQMTDMVYAQGYIKNADGSYSCSDVLPYSVQTYAGNMLGINPDHSKTDSDKLAEVIETLLHFGAATQKLFDYRSDDLADTILKWSHGLEYTENKDGTCSVSGIGTCADTEVYIPKTVLEGTYAGKKVTGIGKSAFRSNKQITSVVIPNTVTSIADEAFFTCGALKSITIPSSVNSIGKNVLGNCDALESISVSLVNLTYCAVDNCLIDKSSKTLIAGCNNSIIPTDGSVAIIGPRAFQGRTGLTTLEIPSAIKQIKPSAFSGCAGISSISIPREVTYIADDAFYGCSGVTSIVVAPENTMYSSAGNCLIRKSTGALIFGCASSVIPTDGSVTSIGEGAFNSCTGLTSITIPDSVTSIGQRAFYGCSGLVSVNMSGKVESIGGYAFQSCKKLAVIDYDGTSAQWTALIKNSAWNGKTGSTYTVMYAVDAPIAEGTMVYYEDFNTVTTVDDLGWSKLTSSSGLVSGTTNTATYTLEEGRLKVVGGRYESYTMIKDSAYMKAACLGDYTIQYDIEYTTAGSARGYFNLLNNFLNGDKYNSVLFRVDGSADNEVHFGPTNNDWCDYDVPGEWDADGADDEATGPSVISKLTNKETTYVLGDKPMLNKNLTIKIQVSHDNGMTVLARENKDGADWITVSKTDATSDGWKYWNTINAYAICLKTRTGTTAYLDNIAIWTGLGDMPEVHTTTAYETAIAGN